MSDIEQQEIESNKTSNEPSGEVQKQEAAVVDKAPQSPVDILQDNTNSLQDTVNDIQEKVGALADAHPNDIAEIDRQTTHAHGILHAIHERIKTLLGGKEAA